MKKHIALVLIAALCLLLSVSALTESVTGRGSLVVQGDGLSAYLDGAGNLLIPGRDEPVNQHPADAIISVDSYRLIFLSTAVDEAGEEQTALVMLDLSTFEEKVIHDSVHAACTDSSNRLYFVPAVDRTQLCLADFDRDIVTTVYTAAEAMDGLYNTAEGLVVTHVENAGSMIYVEATGSFEPCGEPVPSKSVMTDDYQVYIADGDMLYVRRPDALAADAVDMNVYDFTLLNGKIYYLANTGSAVRIKAYDPELLEQKVLSTPEFSLEPQLAASQNRLFALGTDNSVYSVNLETGALEAFAGIYAPELDDGMQVDSWSIEAMSGRLNVYAHLSKTDENPSFTFVEFSSDLSSGEASEPMLVHSIPLADEDLAWTMLQPAKQYSPLSRGSRGDAVSAIQQPLFDHGYYDYYIDGIFGYRTDNAVRLLQGDLGLTVNGVADGDLQRKILSGNFPDYDPYLPLNRGDRGLRVIAMQQRLRSLGYLADGADGIFGRRTQAAVQLFQRENNLTVSESATRETLSKLFAASTAKCSSYIDLYPGDSGYRVRELNKRLKELFYLDGGVEDTYTDETSEAVRRFQTQVELAVDGNASAMLQQRLFAPGAPERSGYSELRRGDDNERVARLQRRLKELDYFSGNCTGYFGKQTQEAVKLFQQKVGMRPSGIATEKMQKLLFSPDAPVYVKPTVLGNPVITIDCFDKRENDVYYLSDASSETGYVAFSWAAEGDVAGYNAVITDDQGNVCLDQDTELMMTTVPISSLTIDRVYTLKITAYPADGDEAHISSTDLRFCRTEVPEEPIEIGTITDVFTSIEPVTRMEDDVYYVKPGTVTFRWYAEGDVAGYRVEIRDSKSNVLIEATTADEQASITTDKMAEGAIYTLCVYAIPTNGTLENAVLETQSFSLETQQPEIPSVSAPEIAAEDASINEDGAYIPTGSQMTLRWNAVENAAQYYIEIRDSGDAFVTSDTTTATGYVLNIDALAAGASYTVRITSVPEGGSVEDDATAVIRITVPEDEIIIELPAPILGIAGVQPSDDGISYVNSPAVSFRWTAVEGAAGYSAILRDSNGSILASGTISDLFLDIDASSLAEGAVYTFSVTAVAPEDMDATALTADLPFVVSLEAEATPEPNENVPATPIELGEPQISISPIEEIVDSVVYVTEGTIEFSWYCDGDLDGYYAEILDAEDNVCTSMTSEKTEASLPSANLIPESVYTLRVVAIPAGSSVDDGSASSVRFAVHAADAEQTTVHEEPTDVDKEPVSKPTEEPDIPAEEPAVLSGLIIGIEPIVETIESINYVEPGFITFSWMVEGPVSGYHLEILIDGTVLTAADTTDNSISVGTDSMLPDAVYDFRITAIPEGGEIEDGLIGEVRFALEPTDVPLDEFISEYIEEPTPEPTEELTPEPTEEPTPEPTEEPTPEPTEEPTPEPTEEPTPEPTEEPTPEPTEEPTPEPTEVPEIDILDPLTWELPLDPEIPDELRIAAVQARLVELEWLLEDEFEEGTLDEATLLAIISFQEDYNAVNGEVLIPIDPELPIVDSATLLALMIPEVE